MIPFLRVSKVKSMMLTLDITEKDDREAIDESNVMDSRTRGAKPEGGYQEPGDTEGLPEDNGKSAVAQ
jgi:hypothetical protein